MDVLINYKELTYDIAMTKETINAGSATLEVKLDEIKAYPPVSAFLTGSKTAISLLNDLASGGKPYKLIEIQENKFELIPNTTKVLIWQRITSTVAMIMTDPCKSELCADYPDLSDLYARIDVVKASKSCESCKANLPLNIPIFILNQPSPVKPSVSKWFGGVFARLAAINPSSGITYPIVNQEAEIARNQTALKVAAQFEVSKPSNVFKAANNANSIRNFQIKNSKDCRECAKKHVSSCFVVIQELLGSYKGDAQHEAHLEGNLAEASSHLINLEPDLSILIRNLRTSIFPGGICKPEPRHETELLAIYDQIRNSIAACVPHFAAPPIALAGQHYKLAAEEKGVKA